MKIIEKKTWPEYFESVRNGDKSFDMRLNDWEINVGDILILKEWDPDTKQYTGRQLEKEVTYILKTKDAENWGAWSREDIEKFGFQIIGFKSENKS
jgi:ASC-1-like (ASCH) protein